MSLIGSNTIILHTATGSSTTRAFHSPPISLSYSLFTASSFLWHCLSPPSFSSLSLSPIQADFVGSIYLVNTFWAWRESKKNLNSNYPPLLIIVAVAEYMYISNLGINHYTPNLFRLHKCRYPSAIHQHLMNRCQVKQHH